MKSKGIINMICDKKKKKLNWEHVEDAPHVGA